MKSHSLKVEWKVPRLCGSLRTVLYGTGHLSIWTPAGGTVWGRLGGTALLEGVHPWRRALGVKAYHYFQILLHAPGSRSQHPDPAARPPLAAMLPAAIESYPSGTLSPNKLFLCISSMWHLITESNEPGKHSSTPGNSSPFCDVRGVGEAPTHRKEDRLLLSAY